MNASEMREQSVEELKGRLDELEEESFNLRFQHTLGQLSSPIRMRDVRREIARVNTLLQEHEQGLRMLPGGVATEGAVATKGAKDE
ncbi:MAG: 50S ribosomal protein L29 [Gemmatimonadetes bacterium]|jgi:large subunit ribosomal protein L29|nr:50S ribosomal protein L29 [Gemmatimonadota bacterium]